MTGIDRGQDNPRFTRRVLLGGVVLTAATLAACVADSTSDELEKRFSSGHKVNFYQGILYIPPYTDQARLTLIDKGTLGPGRRFDNPDGRYVDRPWIVGVDQEGTTTLAYVDNERGYPGKMVALSYNPNRTSPLLFYTPKNGEVVSSVVEAATHSFSQFNGIEPTLARMASDKTHIARVLWDSTDLLFEHSASGSISNRRMAYMMS